MATNLTVSSEAGLVKFLGRKCYDNYFNETVGRDSIMGLGDISTDVNLIENACMCYGVYCAQATVESW